MHWTYQDADKSSDLCQGDILEPNQELCNLFKEIHPHFTNDKYTGFLVITQNCDLVRRKEKGDRCSATHIGLSVIRSIQDIISDSLKDRFGYLAPGIYNIATKSACEALAERIINQNENALGLFYLHPELDAGITVPSVAILRVSISVKASMHYKKLIEARVGRLSKEFQPKLGWMVGNLYSRVGVSDWKEKSEKDVTEKHVLKRILSFSREEPLWLDKKLYSKILDERSDFDKLHPSEQEVVIKKFQPKPPKERILEIIVKTIADTAPKTVKEKHIDIIKQKLDNDDQLEAQMRKFGRS